MVDHRGPEHRGSTPPRSVQAGCKAARTITIVDPRVLDASPASAELPFTQTIKMNASRKPKAHDVDIVRSRTFGAKGNPFSCRPVADAF